MKLYGAKVIDLMDCLSSQDLLSIHNRIEHILKQREVENNNEPLSYSDFLSVRAINCCHAAGIKDKAGFGRITRSDFMKHRNVGRKVMYDVERYMHIHNVDWKQ